MIKLERNKNKTVSYNRGGVLSSEHKPKKLERRRLCRRGAKGQRWPRQNSRLGHPAPAVTYSIPEDSGTADWWIRSATMGEELPYSALAICLGLRWEDCLPELARVSAGGVWGADRSWERRKRRRAG